MTKDTLDRSGFLEEPSPYQPSDTEERSWPPKPLRRLRLVVGAQGAIQLPTELTDAIDICEGEVLLAWVEAGEIRLETVHSAYLKAQDFFRSRVTTGYLSDELIADRKADALREEWE